MKTAMLLLLCFMAVGCKGVDRLIEGRETVKTEEPAAPCVGIDCYGYGTQPINN